MAEVKVKVGAVQFTLVDMDGAGDVSFSVDEDGDLRIRQDTDVIWLTKPAVLELLKLLPVVGRE